MLGILLLLAMILIPIFVFKIQSRRDKTGEETLFSAVIITAIVLVLMVAISSYLGSNIFDELNKYSEDAIKRFVQDETFVDILDIEDKSIEQREEFLWEIYRPMILAFPGVLAVFASLVAFGLYSFISSISDKYVRLKHIRYFAIPKDLVAKLMFFVIVSFIVSNISGLGTSILFESSNVFSKFVLSIQGVALIFMYTYKRKMSSYIAGIVTVLSYLSSLGILMLAIAGALDIIFNLKDRISGKEEGS